MSNIVQRGNNSWLFTVSLGKGPNGYIRKTKTHRVEDEALLRAPKRLENYLELEFLKFRQEIEAGEYITPEKKTFAAFVDDWRVKYAVKHLGKKTLQTYTEHLNARIKPAIGHKRMDSITTFELVNLFDNLSKDKRKDKKDGVLSPSTVQIIYRATKNVFSRAVDWRLIANNPMDGVKKPKAIEREMEVYNADEVEQLLLALEREPIMWRMMISLAITTGMRRGELLGLEWKHVDLKAATIDVKQSLSFTTDDGYEIKEPKTKKSIRKISLPAQMVKELEDYRRYCARERDKVVDLWEGDDSHHFLFTSWNGKPLNPFSVKTWWKRFHARHPQLKSIRFHDLRHTSATLLLNAGVHAKVISSRLGHANITTTLNIYAHALREADQQAADKLDSLFQPKAREVK